MTMNTGGGNSGNGNSQDAGFGGYATHKDLIDAVVTWLPKLTSLFASRFEGKYKAWNTSSNFSSGAPQVGNSSPNNEQNILNSWSNLTEKQRTSILQYALSFRVGGSSCTRKFNRPFAECEETATFQGKTYCVKHKSGSQGDVCDQATAPSSCRRVVSTWKSAATCESLNDAEADKFFSWLSSKFINKSENFRNKTINQFYTRGIPKKRKR